MMRTLGQGRAEKDASRGALQWRRGEAPNAALRLSPTFAADNGQRMKPHAASATINARATPHAMARRMLTKSPFEPRRTTGYADSYRERARRQGAEISIETKGARGEDGTTRLAAVIWRSPKPDLSEKQSGCLLDRAAPLHVSVKSALCGRKAADTRTSLVVRT